MISLSAGLVLAFASFSAAFVSGIFGMVGGQILLALLLYYLPVSAAMTIYSALMFTSGLWRAVLWRQHINWRITGIFTVGVVIGYTAILFVAFVPSKPMIYLGLGLTPLIGMLVPQRFAPDISKGWLAAVCGCIVMVLQIVVGAAGNVFDMFFQASPLTRHTVVATKAVTQLVLQALRFAYFGSLALEAGQSVPWWVLASYVALTFVGGSASGGVLNRMTDQNFRKWTRWIIMALSAVYVMRGLWLLAA